MTTKDSNVPREIATSAALLPTILAETKFFINVKMSSTPSLSNICQQKYKPQHSYRYIPTFSILPKSISFT